MLEPLIHFILPFVALTLSGVGWKRSLLFSFFALLPDLDIFILVHRSISHSLLVISGAALPLLFLSRRFRPGLQRYVLLAFLCTVSHLVLDVFAGYTPILWPLYMQLVWVKVEFSVHMSSLLSVSLNAGVVTKPTTFPQLQYIDAPLFTGEGLMVSAVLLAPILYRAVASFSRAR